MLIFSLIALSASITVVVIFKNFTKEIIEDDIFEKYLKESESISRNLEPLLKQYEHKISLCIVKSSECDPQFVQSDKAFIKDKEYKEEETRQNKFYFSKESGNTYLVNQVDNKDYYWINLKPIYDALIDISVSREDYIFILNNKSRVVMNISSPYPINEVLNLDKDTHSKLKAEITSSSFYLIDTKLNIKTMNLFHTLPYLNLKLVIGNENKVVFYDLNRIENFLFKILFVLIPSILLVTFLVSKYQTNRFQKIIFAISELKRENYSVRVNSTESVFNDELKDLMDSFNFTAMELEKFNKMNIDKILAMNSKLVETNYELAEAKSVSEKANKAKTLFLANMSHDIRTPLNSIIGYTQMIKGSEISHEFSEDINNSLNNIEVSGKNLAELINNILDLSKIESGKMEIFEEVVNLKILVQSIYSINKSQVDKKNLNFVYSVENSLPEFINIDRTKLNQILMNLCSNAIKFSPDSKSIYLNVTKRNNNIIFEVIDEGVGIPESKQKKVFEAFEQTDSSVMSKFGGTGLGLNIVKMIVELMKGKIELESIETKGSTFRVILPLSIANDVSVQEKEKKKIHFQNKYTVLIIDDNIMNYDILKFHLKKLGLKTLYADDGEAGLEMAIKEMPDLILLDIHMPKMNGIMVRKELIARKDTAQIPTIVMSADVFSESKQEAIEVSFTDFVSKPIDFKQLETVLLKYLKLEG